MRMHVTIWYLIDYFLELVYSNRISISSRFRHNGPETYLGHDLDLSRSCDVVGHVTNRFAVCDFLFMVHCNRASISKLFYQRGSIAGYATAGVAIARMSVCLSVCLSVRLYVRYCIKTKEDSVMISSPSESPNILVSGNIWRIPKFGKGHPSDGDLWDLGGYEMAIFAIFRPINHCISETVQDRTEVAINH